MAISFTSKFRSVGLGLRDKAKTAVWRSLPHLKPCAIGIGAGKAGTTALYEYLALHPRVAPSLIKEIDFFNCNSRYARGIRFYHSFFPCKTPGNLGKVTFDITPGYLIAANKAAQRIYDYNPNMKLLVLLRNPIMRAYSAWQMFRRNYKKNPDWFFEWLYRCDETIERDSFVRRLPSFGVDFAGDIANEIEVIEKGRTIEMPILSHGMYHAQLSCYFRLFSRNQVLVLSSEEMLQDTIGHLRRIEAFVGLPPHSWSPDETKPRFTGGYEKVIPQKAYDLLDSFYRGHNRDLFSMLQREFPWGQISVSKTAENE
jgi:hypothetical protein